MQARSSIDATGAGTCGGQGVSRSRISLDQVIDFYRTRLRPGRAAATGS
jgi:hypothetical protein